MLRSYTTRTSRPVSVIPDVIAIGVDDQPPAVIPRACAQELFTFSPFGLSCRQCAKQVQIKLDERSIRDHLKKHCIDSRISTVRSILFEFTKQVDLAKATGTIAPYRQDGITYIGYACVCGHSFPRKDNAVRHCKRLSCDHSQLRKIELIKLCCGRYVSQAQVNSFFSETPHTTQQFNHQKAVFVNYFLWC